MTDKAPNTEPGNHPSIGPPDQEQDTPDGNHDPQATPSHLIDPWFWHHKRRYFGQCGLAMLCTLVVLFIMRSVAQEAVVVVLGASAFIVFALPHSRVAGARCVVGGYVIGVGIGTACFWLERALPLPDVEALGSLSRLFYGSLAVGMVMFLMVITNTEHPPAAGVALGLVLEQWSWVTVIVALGGAVVLSLLRKLFLRKLINLL